MSKMEIRNYQVELRMDTEDEFILRGTASVFNALSVDLGGFREIIEPGAFTDTLKDDIRALWNHNDMYVIGRTSNETLELTEDDVGLHYTVQLPDTSYARDLHTLVKRKDITQNSFGFWVEHDNWSKDGDTPIRTITKIKLVEISPVTFPAYPQTSVEARDLKGLLTTVESGDLTVDDIHKDQGYIRGSNLDLLKRRLELLRLGVM